MTGNVLIKNRTPSSDVPYLFGLPKQKTTLLRRTSVLRSKTLAEGEFTSPEHFNFLLESKKEVTTYVVTSFWSGRRGLARSTAVPRHAQRAPNAPLGRFLASLAPCSPLCPLEPKKSALLRRTSVCAAKPWRRANSLRPSILISCRNPKRGHNLRCDLFFGAGDEARTRYLHLGKVALYQMSYARGTRCTIPDIFRFVKHRF